MFSWKQKILTFHIVVIGNDCVEQNGNDSNLACKNELSNNPKASFTTRYPQSDY